MFLTRDFVSFYTEIDILPWSSIAYRSLSSAMNGNTSFSIEVGFN